ncbi:MAG TPA: Ig-like domain repeat protein [Terriglobia bacterium]|nr:Ig-like domain repeat protein [Terriglobia bacterium]
MGFRGGARWTRASRTVQESSITRLTQALAFCLILATGAAGQSARIHPQIIQPIDTANRVVLRGNTPPLARAENDRGAAPDGLLLNHMLLVLKRPPAQETALRKLLIEQQVKSSPSYHHWLTPEQFGEEFGPAEADIQTVREWLSTQGFQVDRVVAGRSIIEFSGTAGQVREAFHTGIHQYVVNGNAYWSNAADPQIPAALAPAVAGIASLNNFPIKPLSHQLNFPVRVERTEGPKPLYTFTGTNGTILHALSPGDFETIYNVPSSIGGAPAGQGETIAIVASSNVNLQDSTNFRDTFGLAGPVPNVIVNGPDPGLVSGYEGEADLDMEWAGAIAQYATIDLVVSQDTFSTPGVALSALYIVDNNLTPVMSVSYEYCESTLGVAGNAFYNSLWEQAAAQGISVVVGAGDQGSAACFASNGDISGITTGLAVSGIASTSFDVSVGGTDFDDSSNPTPYWNSTNTPQHSSALSYIPEITWNDSCAQVGDSASCEPAAGTAQGLLAGGGGPSMCGLLSGSDPDATCVAGYPKPSWQTGPGVPADGVRDVPDVSLFSGVGRNGSFYLFCEADENPDQSANCSLGNSTEVQGVGGTSAAAQVFAAIMALVDQKTGERQGNPDFILYTLAAQPGASCPSNSSAVSNPSCVFYDIITGNNSLPCAAGTMDCPSPTASGSQSVLTVPGSNPAAPAWNTGPGYDLATGLGSVNVTNLLNKWSSVSFTPSATTLSISPTTLTHGESANVNVQVTAQGGTPTGAVSLLSSLGNTGEGIASLTLSSGQASGSVSSLPGGTYNVTAHYPGNGTFGASDSSPVQVTVTKENSTTTLAIETQDSQGRINNTNASSFIYGSFYALNVEVENAAGNSCGANQAPATACPSGTVNLTDNGAPLNSTVNTLNSLGEMQDNLIQLSPGTHSLVASYLGDGSFNSSASSPDLVTVTQATTVTYITASNTTVQADNSVTFTATVDAQSNGASPTGTVQFFNGSTPISGTVSYSSIPDPQTGFAELTATLSTVLPATANVMAQYSGDANYRPSMSYTQLVTVVPGFGVSISPTSITIPAAGQSGSATVTVASGGGFSGTVILGCQLPPTLTEASCSVTPQQLSTSGQSTLTITTTAPQTAAALFHWRNPPGYFLASIILFCLGLMVLFCVSAGRRRLRYMLGFSLLCAILLSLAMAGCGGGGQASAPSPPPPNPGTPSGTYTVTITAASGASSHQASLTVIVQ